MCDAKQTFDPSRLDTVVIAALALIVGAVLPAPASANGPPGKPPYPKMWLPTGGDPYVQCTDSDGSTVYEGVAWTLEPLIRGPMFAPVVLWLSAAGNQPVAPLEFTSDAQGDWYTIDSGPGRSGQFWGATGRPVGYGTSPTDPSPRVRCLVSMTGYDDLGDYTITPGLARAIEVPVSLIGRRLHFDGEGGITFTVPRTQFPLTATAVATTLRTPNNPPYGRVWLDGTDVRCTAGGGGSEVYRGTAFTLAPLVRGYQWAPMALWLKGDRVVTLTVFLGDVSGSYATTSGSPALSGGFSMFPVGPPSGYGTASVFPANGTWCEWSGVHDRTLTVTAALATQLGLPTTLVGRTVRLNGTYFVRASTPGWLFPPRG